MMRLRNKLKKTLKVMLSCWWIFEFLLMLHVLSEWFELGHSPCIPRQLWGAKWRARRWHHYRRWWRRRTPHVFSSPYFPPRIAANDVSDSREWCVGFCCWHVISKFAKEWRVQTTQIYVYFERKYNRRNRKQTIADRELFRDAYIQPLYNNRLKKNEF